VLRDLVHAGYVAIERETTRRRNDILIDGVGWRMTPAVVRLRALDDISLRAIDPERAPPPQRRGRGRPKGTLRKSLSSPVPEYSSSIPATAAVFEHALESRKSLLPPVPELITQRQLRQAGKHEGTVDIHFPPKKLPVAVGDQVDDHGSAQAEPSTATLRVFLEAPSGHRALLVQDPADLVGWTIVGLHEGQLIVRKQISVGEALLRVNWSLQRRQWLLSKD